MRLVDGLIGGLAGALSVTILHELTRKYYAGAPRLDKLGEQAAEKIIEATGNKAPNEKELYGPAMAGDLVANALYYGFAAANTKNPVRTAGILGVSAGLGAINLPGTLGLNEKHASGTTERKLITLALYTIGGLVTGAVIKMMQRQA